MQTYHIHIGGLVQGVGFRPFVYRTAVEMGIKGWVNNSPDGVHIEFTASQDLADDFYYNVLSHPPVNAIITHHSIHPIAPREFDSFSIQKSSNDTMPDLLITPDIAICPDCLQEISDHTNRRYQYPFTTCLNCGPRYSIMQTLPYDRHNTTMDPLPMCEQCGEEYINVADKRHFSQTNTCAQCPIPMHLYDANGKLICNENEKIFNVVDTALTEGRIVAAKGIGGYLLLCDATNENAIETLRERKHRPSKPFALLYKDIEMVLKDMIISPAEQRALRDKSAPIVLCRSGENTNRIIKKVIAPGLHRTGIMLPYTALLFLIIERFNKPLVATSANFSGSPVIFSDEEAMEFLGEMADLVLTYDREIVTPQDDSVLQYSSLGQKIILRRSRGLAPAFFNHALGKTNECILAMGGELKSAFALYNNGNLLVSQYLGDQASLGSQKSFVLTKNYLQQLFQCRPQKIIVDKHPGYFVSERGRAEAMKKNIELMEVQHHKAHFAAVLAENNLLNETEPVLGIVWDGAGYGDDQQIWGGEFFIFDNNTMSRVAHLDYFPQLLGDKMNREPRLAALGLLIKMPEYQESIKHQFTQTEWKYYMQLIGKPGTLFTSSMGRFLDGIAALLGICSFSTFEGEAAMRLEACAATCKDTLHEFYTLPLKKGILKWDLFIAEMMEDILLMKEKNHIAKKVFYSLVKSIAAISNGFKVNKIAFSGGVFQNAMLNDMIPEVMKENKQLYFHQQLSPNDECIGFGQLACYFIQKNHEKERELKISDATVPYNKKSKLCV